MNSFESSIRDKESHYFPLVSLEEDLTSFSTATRIPALFISSDFLVEWHHNKGNNLCASLDTENKAQWPCFKSLMAGKIPDATENYLYTCPANLSFYVYPVSASDASGYAVLGPISTDFDRSTLVKTLLSVHNLSNSKLPEFFTHVDNLSTFDSTELPHIESVLKKCLSIKSSGKTSSINLDIFSESEAISSDHFTLADQDPEILIQGLITAMNDRDRESGKASFKRFLSQLTVAGKGNLENVRGQFLGACGILSAHFSEDLSREYFLKHGEEDINRVTQATTLDAFNSAAFNIFDNVVDCASSTYYSGNSPLIEKAILYTKEHFSEGISLKDVAKELYVNPNYFSTLFKQETHMPFVTFLTRLKINKAKELLLETSTSLCDIGLSSGFISQSYFTKTFKEVVGVTPSDYRANHKKTAM